MVGNIIGDLAGSIYEYHQVNDCHPIKIENLIEKNAFISDDSILTIAIADAIISHSSYEDKLKEYAVKYNNCLPNCSPYFKSMFSPNFYAWAIDSKQGTSSGNGAMMRIAPVGFLFDNEQDVVENARLATIPSHNSSSAVECAQTIALIIYYARNGLTKKQIKEKLHLSIKKPTVVKFNYTCDTTLDICLYSFFKANSFTDAIKRAISFGGDTDTNACIVGGMAEAMWGVGENLKQLAMQHLPDELKHVVNEAYKKMESEHNFV